MVSFTERGKKLKAYEQKFARGSIVPSGHSLIIHGKGKNLKAYTIPEAKRKGLIKYARKVRRRANVGARSGLEYLGLR